MREQAKLFALWNWLPAFYVVAQTQHLPTASRRLHLSVSALSRTMKNRESAVGYALFERAGRGLRLNAHGRVLQAVVERAVEAFAGELERVASATSSTVLRVAIAHTVSQRVVVPAVLSALPGVVPSDGTPNHVTMVRRVFRIRRAE